MNEVVIREFIEEHCGETEEVGTNLFAACPFCGKKRRHWNISLITGKHHCYHCGKGGIFEGLCRWFTGKNPTKVIAEYTDAMSLATLTNLYEPEEEDTMFVDWQEGTKPLDSKSLTVARGLQYLNSRGIPLEFALQHELRIGVSGKYADMVIIPIHYEYEVVNFLARRFRGVGRRYDGPRKGETPLPKSALFWNWDEACKLREVVLVEGFFDAVRLKQKGLNVAALLGKEIHPPQILKAAQVWDKVVILLDGGFIQDAVKVGRALEGLTHSILIGIMGEEQDPADFPEVAIQAVQDAQDLACF